MTSFTTVGFYCKKYIDFDRFEIYIRMKFIVLLVLVSIALINAYSANVLKVPRRSILNMSNLQYDNQGYIIKPRDWFNGLSTDPGGSLTDPRAVPPVMKEFAEKIKR